MELPDLSAGKILTIDTETKDPNLRTQGPGFVRGDAHVSGIAVGTEDWWQYFPVRHPGGGNLAPNIVSDWLNDQIKCQPNRPIVGANLLYDLEALHFEGIQDVENPLIDVQIAEPLIDEEQHSYALDHLGTKYLNETKDEQLLLDAYQNLGLRLRKTKDGKAVDKQDLWKLPAKYVGPYAEQDIRLPALIWEKQKKVFDAENLWDIWKLESSLIPLLLKMRLQGVRIDMDQAEKVALDVDRKKKDIHAQLNAIVGFEMNVDSTKHLVKAFNALGISYPRTKSGNPSFAKDFLERCSAPLAKDILAIRKYRKLSDEFIRGHILGNCVNGRIHAQFNQLRDDDGGTRTGRFSSSHPNLQNIPVRDKELGTLIRSLFIPEEGEDWLAADYSQQEPRLMVHYGVLRNYPSAIDVASQFIADKTTDYYKIVITIGQLEERLGLSFKDCRDMAKIIQLAKSYGMGKETGAANMNTSVAEYEKFDRDFDELLPFISGVSQEVQQKGSRSGFVQTLGGRHRHFNLWEPSDWVRGEFTRPLPRAEAEAEYPGRPLRRAGLRKAFNSLIQGSGADMMKMAMVLCWKATGRVPLLTVHDEQDSSIPRGSEGQKLRDQIVEIMEHAYETKVPMLVEANTGKNWGEAK